MVDENDTDNRVVGQRDPTSLDARELPLLLLGGFRTIVDQLHDRLQDRGHPGVRPTFGFTLLAVGSTGGTASDVGRRLGVSKQAAGKTLDRLEHLGYVTRDVDPHDTRRRVVSMTDRGIDLLHQSAAIFEEIRAEWAARIGADRLSQLESDLRALGLPSQPLDAAGWLNS